MRTMSARSSLFVACLAFVSAALSVAPAFSSPSGTGVQLALVALLAASLLLVVATCASQQPVAQAVCRWRRAAGVTRAPARQCDPDAAGHVRARAPGSSRTSFAR